MGFGDGENPHGLGVGDEGFRVGVRGLGVGLKAQELGCKPLPSKEERTEKVLKTFDRKTRLSFTSHVCSTAVCMRVQRYIFPLNAL